jgi:hypothetical protein
MALPETGSNLPTVSDWRSLPVPERLLSIRNKFLYHPDISRVLERLEHIFHSAPGTGVLMHGVQKVGIASLISRFAGMHPPQARKPVALQPVILTTPTSKLTAGGLAESISCDARWPPFAGSSSKIPELQVDHLFRESGTRMLFMLRASLLANGRSNIAPEAVPFIVNLLDRGAATFILAGLDDLPDLIMNCRHLRDAFFLRMPVKALAMDAHWVAMIGTLANQLPFEETEMAKGDMPALLHDASEGKPPELLLLSETASTVAYYEDRSTVLRKEYFKKAFGYAWPSKTHNPFAAGVSASTHHARKAMDGESAKRRAMLCASQTALSCARGWKT